MKEGVVGIVIISLLSNRRSSKRIFAAVSPLPLQHAIRSIIGDGNAKRYLVLCTIGCQPRDMAKVMYTIGCGS